MTALIVAAAGSFGHHAEALKTTEGPAAAAQDQVAAMYGLSFQNNTYFGVERPSAGPNGAVRFQVQLLFPR